MSTQIMTSHRIEEVSMLDHISIGVHDLARTKQFYDAVLRPMGYACLSEGADALGYGRDQITLWIGKAEHPVPPDPRSNLHFCFNAATREAVDAFHAAALSAGGADNGAPGLRPDYGAGYYAAFVVDPDGYRIEACFGG
jgi:catechol 2,3-dioxygenase-like lactoylglutathione lyase family enzyme